MTAPTLSPRRGRPSNADLIASAAKWRERAQDLATEIRARDAEQGQLAEELGALGLRVELAIRAGRPDVAMHVAARLLDVAATLRRRSAA